MEFVRIFECMCLILIINILYVLTINMFCSVCSLRIFIVITSVEENSRGYTIYVKV